MITSLIKWCATRLPRVARSVGKPPLQQVSYLGKTTNVSQWMPYGFDAAAPAGKLALLLAILGNVDDQVSIPGSPGEGPVLADTEVAMYHPPTGSKVHMKADGSIVLQVGAIAFTLTTTGVTVAGNLTVTGSLTAGAATLASAVIAGTLSAGTCTFGASVTAGGVNIGSAHSHVGSPTAPTGAISNTGAPV